MGMRDRIPRKVRECAQEDGKTQETETAHRKEIERLTQRQQSASMTSRQKLHKSILEYSMEYPQCDEANGNTEEEKSEECVAKRTPGSQTKEVL